MLSPRIYIRQIVFTVRIDCEVHSPYEDSQVRGGVSFFFASYYSSVKGMGFGYSRVFMFWIVSRKDPVAGID